jgi:hypothetical protein
LDKVARGCGLAGVTISRGTAIPNLQSPAISTKARTFDSDLDEYIGRLQWLARKYVVLYDVGGRRAWLVDGATALLHLVRASLRFSSTEDVTGEFNFTPRKLQEAPENTNGRSASISVLKSPQNLGLRLYRTMYMTFRDKVEEIYHLLEKILAHQVQVGVLRQARIGTDPCSQGILEGFDFMDLAGDTDAFGSHGGPICQLTWMAWPCNKP